MHISMTYPEIIRLRKELEIEVSRLEYSALERLVAFLLQSMAYKEVRIVDGGHPRGRNSYGGFSLMGRYRGPVHDTLALVQVKQIDIQRRHVDELRGAMVRLGSGQGTIVTTKQIPNKASYCADLVRGWPIRLISRRHLVKLMIAHSLGVRPEPGLPRSSANLIVDHLFFALLGEMKV